MKLLGASESTKAAAGVNWPLITPDAHVATGSLYEVLADAGFIFKN